MNGWKKALATLLATGAAAIAIGCGGYTTQEAYEVCKDIQGSVVVDDETLKACVACFENCDDCIVKGSSPATFYCPGEEPSDTSSSSTGGS